MYCDCGRELKSLGVDRKDIFGNTYLLCECERCKILLELVRSPQGLPIGKKLLGRNR